MALPSLNGPHAPNVSMIDETVGSKAVGVYLLSTKAGGDVNARRLGRSDHDLTATLKRFVGLYSHFSRTYAASPRDAYEMECELYHSVKPPEKTGQPLQPAAADWSCPQCGKCRGLLGAKP